MPRGLILFLVSLEKHRAATLRHVLAFAVKIRPCHLPASADGNTIGALHATAAIVLADKEIIPVATLQDERSLYGVGTRVLRSGVLFRWLMPHGVAAGDGERLLSLGYMHSVVQLHQLNAVPERAERHPRLSFLVHDESGVYGVPVIAVLLGTHDATLVAPAFVVGEAGVAQQSYGRRVTAEGGTGVGQPPFALEVNDIRSPDVLLKARHAVVRPRGNVFYQPVAIYCPRLAVTGSHVGDMVTRGEKVIGAILQGHHGIMDENRVRLPSHGTLCLLGSGGRPTEDGRHKMYYGLVHRVKSVSLPSCPNMWCGYWR